MPSKVTDFGNDPELKLIANQLSETQVSKPKPIKERDIKSDQDLINALKEIVKSELDSQNELRAERYTSVGKQPPLPNVKLSPTNMAKVLYSQVPMFKIPGTDKYGIYIYSYSNGIYDISDTYFQTLTQGVISSYEEKDVKATKYALNILVPVGEPENSEYLVPLNNGIYNYETKELLPFDPKYRFVAKIATDYNPKYLNVEPSIKMKNGGIWKPSQLLKSLSVGDAEIEQVLYETIADAINGNYSRKQAILLLGDPKTKVKNGNNGKGTFQQLIRNIAGKENVADLRMDQFSHEFLAFELMGKTVDIGDDLEPNIVLKDESRYRSAVTGDAITTNIKNKNPLTFVFKGAIIQSMNGLPITTNKTNGTYRRMLIVPFKANFTANENRDIKDKYIDRTDVKEWFVVQALELGFFERFTEPQASKELRNSYEVDNDIIMQFFQDILLYETESRLATNALYEKFSEWANAEGITNIPTRRKFTGEIVQILNGLGTTITAITREEFAKLQKDYDSNVVGILPIGSIEFVHKTARVINNPEKALVFPLREQVKDAIKLADQLPAKTSSMYSISREKLIKAQSKIFHKEQE